MPQCILCGSTEHRALFTYEQPDRYELAIGVSSEGYSRQWVKCLKCGLHRSEYSRDPALMDKIYESKYRDTDSSWRKQSADELFQKIIQLPSETSETHFRANWIDNSIRQLQQAKIIDIPENRSLLDIGGASGVFAYEMHCRGWQAEIIDPSFAGAFVEKYGVSYRQGFYGPDSIATKFNMVSMVFVLEHLQDPKTLLQQVKANVDTNGLLYIEVPDDSAFRSCNKDHDTFNSCHLWLFGARQMHEILSVAGFEIHALQRYVTFRGYPAIMLLAGLSSS